jgi:hypothetical protein
VCRECVRQVLFRGRERQVADVQILAHVILSGSSLTPHPLPSP